ncbi:MAG: class II aldolase/adducin family protein [Pseudonocardiales bacterium]
MMADEFGGEVPVGPIALIGDDSIGRGIVASLTGHRSPAVLMRKHGVFTIGAGASAWAGAWASAWASAWAAVKAAVLCEDVARTVHIARQLGEPLPIGQGDVEFPPRPVPERLRTGAEP